MAMRKAETHDDEKTRAVTGILVEAISKQTRRAKSPGGRVTAAPLRPLTPGSRPRGNAVKAIAAKYSPKYMTAVHARAVEVIGSEERALRWLGSPIPALDYATPVSLLTSEEGRDAVLDVLGRLEHGVL